jgi:hypothetical protein
VSREIHLAEVARGRLFAEGADARGGPDRVWQLDARTGRVTGSVAMPQFTPVGMVAVGNDVWLPVAGGRAVVVGP